MRTFPYFLTRERFSSSRFWNWNVEWQHLKNCLFMAGAGSVHALLIVHLIIQVRLTVPHKESSMTLLYFTGYLKNSILMFFRGSSYFTSEEHALLIDVLVVTSSIKDPVIALAMLLAIFFILNREIQLTLTFFQRCLVGINLVSGTKYAKQDT